MRELLSVTPTSSPTGFVVADDIMGVTDRFRTPAPVEPSACSTVPFALPVDHAVAVDSPAVRVPKFPLLVVRDGSGSVVQEVAPRETARLGPGVWTVELTSMAVKTYLHVGGAFTASVDDEGRVLRADQGVAFRVGIRSRHDRPAATVTTPETPNGVARALSHLGSALKTTSPERSWPTLRGHPPLLERGEELHLPERPEGERADESLVVEVPASLSYLYPVASLAFYLDARVTLGETPCLRAADGDWSVPLVDDPGRKPGTDPPATRRRGFERRVARTLRHLFTLDCLTRTEGLYPFSLAERDAVERRLDAAGVALDFGSLYDAPLGERTRRYLDVPFDAVEPAVPRWKLTADVAPEYDSLAHLPFLADDLGTIRCLPGATRVPSTPDASALDAFVRGDGSGPSPVGPDRHGGDPSVDGQVIRPRSTDSVEHVWVGDGYPVGATKAVMGATHRRLRATASGDIAVAVVVNDPEMREELAVSELYGLRDLVAFDVERYERLTTDELATLLAEERDFLHFVGHVDERGLQCADGYLDAAALDHVGTRAFMLNACRSYAQAHHLVDAGAIGGLATVENVENVAATGLGRTLARLLNAGFSLGGALDVLGSETRLGEQYLVVGDHNLTVAQCRSGLPVRMSVERTDEDRFDVTAYGYPTTDVNVGSVYAPTVGDDERRYLGGGRMVSSSLSGEEVAELFSLERLPVTLADTDGVVWSDELDLDAV